MVSFESAYYRTGLRSQHCNLDLLALGDYYDGAQPLGYLQPELARVLEDRIRSLVINWPRLVVDSIEERLDVEGFRVAGQDDGDDELWRIWQDNDLDEQSQQAHLDSLIYGRSFAMVGANEEDPETPLITIESAKQMSVEWDPRTRQVIAATKIWCEGDYTYRTRYDPTWIIREVKDLTSKTPMWAERSEPVENVLGVVPVVPFVNRPRLLRPQGVSEMTDVIPIVDAINKLATDMMVGAEYHAVPRRWATGIDMGPDETEHEVVRKKLWKRWSTSEANRVWTSDSPDTTFGQFPQASLDNFVSAVDMLTSRVAALSGLPPHYFGQVGENPASADALRASEAPLVKRVMRKQRVLGGAWERVMRLALLVRDGAYPDEYKRMETIWRSPETPTIAQQADAAVKLVQAEIVTPEQAQEDLGYSPTQRARMAAEKSASALGPVKAQLDEANRLMREQGLSQPAAFAAVGLLQAAGLQAQATAQQP